MSNRHWEDISAEKSRTYLLYGDQTVTFLNPTRVGIKRTFLKDGSYEDSHSIRCADGTGGYVKDFQAIYWAGKGATDEQFGDRVNAGLTG